MKKIAGLVLMLCTVLSTTSCNKTKSYTKRLEEEKDAIERLMDEENIEVLRDYPEDGVFKENQFVKLDNGVYLNVVDSGNGNHLTEGIRQKVVCRFKARFFKSDTMEIDGFASDYLPVTMTCQISYDKMYASYVSDGGLMSGLEDFVSEGLASGLLHVGDSSIVKLIVPFKVSSTYLRQSYEPIYFTRVKYIFEK